MSTQTPSFMAGVYIHETELHTDICVCVCEITAVLREVSLNRLFFFSRIKTRRFFQLQIFIRTGVLYYINQTLMD